MPPIKSNKSILPDAKEPVNGVSQPARHVGNLAPTLKTELIQALTGAAQPLPEVQMPRLTEEEGRTANANVDRLLATCGDRMLHVKEWKKWVVWDGFRWARDPNRSKVRGLAMEVTRAMWHELANVRMDSDVKRQAVHFVSHSDSPAMADQMVRGAAGKLERSCGTFDFHPFLLNCANGTVDLTTGVLRPPRQEDMLTKSCPTPYAPGAGCPTWLRFLGDVFAEEEEVIRYVQRLLGYGITGSVREQVMPIFWGDGGNGKSTLVDTLHYVLGGSICGTPPQSLFVVPRSGEPHPTQLMTLQGMRLMIGGETESGCRLNEALIKNLTGGDQVTGRGVFENFSTFSPTHKLFLCTNDKPQVRGTNHAIWRRLKLVEFGIKFEGDRDDRHMREKLEAEAEGILAWMVHGCLDWQKKGLDEPRCVQMATTHYRNEEDVLGRFIAECCEVGARLQEETTVLHQAFSKWSPSLKLTMTKFGTELTRRGFASSKVTTGPHKNRSLRTGLQLLNQVGKE